MSPLSVCEGILGKHLTARSAALALLVAIITNSMRPIFLLDVFHGERFRCFPEVTTRALIWCARFILLLHAGLAAVQLVFAIPLAQMEILFKHFKAT